MLSGVGEFAFGIVSDRGFVAWSWRWGEARRFV